MIIILTLMLGLEIFYVVLFACIAACEGAVGLSALISIIRTKKRQRIAL